jgi:hypothetical protein
LSDGVQNWGLILDNGVRSIQEQPQTSSTIVANSQGGQFGDYDPSQAHIQQNEWIGGRANEKFTDDNSRYYDAKNLWTLTSGAAMPSLQWKYALGTRLQNVMPLADTYDWRSLVRRYISIRFTPTANYTTTKVYLWIKKVGAPGTLTVELRADGTATQPNASVLKTASTTGATLERDVIYNQVFTWNSSQALTAATPYHIVVYGATTDNPANHWEVMAVADTDANPAAFASADEGANWSTTPYKLYYRVTDADPAQRYLFFYYVNKLYAVTIPDSGASKLYYAVSTAAGFSTASGNDWVMTEVATTGLTLVTDVLVSNGAVYFAQGASVNIRRWNGTTWADDGTNKATYLYNYTDPTQGAVIWRSLGVNVSKSVVKAWGTNLAFGADIAIGDAGDTYPITGMTGYNDALWVFKGTSVWSVRLNRASKLDVGLDDIINVATGKAATAHGLYLYFSYATSLEQLYGSTLSDVGPGHGAGLPNDRTGYIAGLESVFSKLFVAVDGGAANYSSVLIFDGINYHELWRGQEIGKRIRTIFWHPSVNNSNPYLWIDYGGDIVYIKFPRFGFNVIRDTSMYYVPDAHLITSTYDMNASRLPKIFKELTLITQNLATSKNQAGRVRSPKITHNSKISLDYQLDDDIGTSFWQEAGDFFVSPSDTVQINESQKYAIRLRLRIQTSDANNPPIINATVLEGVARTPIKYQWVMRAKLSSMQSTLNGAPDHKPDALLRWLQEKAARAEKLTMHSTFATLDNREVMAEPPSVSREFSDTVAKSWGGTVTIILREA